VQPPGPGAWQGRRRAVTVEDVSDDTAARAWLYEGGSWVLADDPVPQGSEPGSDWREEYAAAGFVQPFLVLGLHSEDNDASAAQIVLYTRQGAPQCMIEIEGRSGSYHRVYAARLPDGLDLVARWAPMATAGALTPLARGLLRPDLDNQGRPSAHGLVETIAKRARHAAQ